MSVKLENRQTCAGCVCAANVYSDELFFVEGALMKSVNALLLNNKFVCFVGLCIN